MKHSKQNVAKHSGASVAVRFNMIFVAAAICSVLILAFAGYSIANGFGTGENKSTNDIATADTTFAVSDGEADVLKAGNKRDVSALYNEIYQEEEAARIAAEEAQRKHDKECIENAVARKAAAGNPADGVDFTIGREEFVKVWGERINNYLAGSPLAGYGETFADAAFEYGVDPRVSPAISNTESTKGANCFRPHNAWGWMGSAGWPDWETAIYAHISGWASGYGYTVTIGAAAAYCPPTYQDWYAKTTYQMTLI